MLQRAIAKLYSRLAKRAYDPLIARGTFRILARQMHAEVLEQGRRAVAEGRPILDLPVGTAYFTGTWAADAGELVVGADIAWGMVSTAAQRTRSFKNIAITQADAQRLPFCDGAFGAVMCTNGLQVMPGRTKVMQEIARVLEQDGIVHLSILTLPLATLLPRRIHHRLPAVLLGRAALDTMLRDAGFIEIVTKRARFAWFISGRRA